MKLFVLPLFLFPLISFGQTTYIPLGSEEYILLNRMEIKMQKDSALNFSKTKPYSREKIVSEVLRLDTGVYITYGTDPDPGKIGKWSRVDEYNIDRLLINNIEWVPRGDSLFKSRKPWGKTFYQTPGTLYEAHVKDFDLAINPVLYFQGSKEKDNDETLFLNTRGVRVRGRIANKIGFDSYITDNQERDPLYVQEWVNKYKAVPGKGYYKSF